MSEQTVEAPSRPERQSRLRREPGGRRRVVKVLLSDVEAAVIEARAEAAGVSVQRLMVESVLSPERTSAERRAVYVTLLAAHRQVSGAATNLNQLAKVANTTGRIPAELEELAGTARAALARLEVVLGEL